MTMNRKDIDRFTAALAAETDTDNICLLLGATIERLAEVDGPELAAAICGRAQDCLLNLGTIT
jgi:hypothetical protein